MYFKEARTRYCLIALGLVLIFCSRCKTDKAIPTRPNTTFQSLHYLDSLSGLRTVGGIHNREPNATPEIWTDSIFATTGKYPGLWSGDFLFQQDNISNRQVMINEAIKQWHQGALVNIMWHACNPALSEPCGFDSNGVLSHLTDNQWTQLLTDGTDINTQWKNRIDEVCVYLQQLKDAKVEVLWRPLHEMNQGSFWWGGRPGPEGTRKLYQLMHDYMTQTKGLTNLIWVWDLQDFGSLSDDVHNYNPGSSYWDVAALDFYDGSGYTAAKYNTMISVANGKPLAIGECQVLPYCRAIGIPAQMEFFHELGRINLLRKYPNPTQHTVQRFQCGHPGQDAWVEMINFLNNDCNGLKGGGVISNRALVPSWQISRFCHQKIRVSSPVLSSFSPRQL